MSIAYNTSIVRSGLVLHLDAANIKSYPGTGTAWKDLSGSGNNGTLVNGVSYNSANSGSFTFDGVNDYVLTPSVVLNKPFTLSFVCSVNQIKNQGFYIARTVLGKGIAVFALGDISGSNAVRFDTGDHQWTTGYIIPLNSIVSLTLTVDSTSKNLFVNGELHSSTSFTASINDVSPTVGTIGASQVSGDGYANYVNGKIFTFKSYNRALLASEIKQNFEALRGRYGI